MKVVEAVCVSAAARTGELAFWLASNAGVFDISDIRECFDHEKSSSISQLINGKLRDLQKLLKYFNETTTSAFNLFLLYGMVRYFFYAGKIYL